MEDGRIFLFSVHLGVDGFISGNDVDFQVDINGADSMTDEELKEFQDAVNIASLNVRRAIIRRVNKSVGNEED